MTTEATKKKSWGGIKKQTLSMELLIQEKTTYSGHKSNNRLQFLRNSSHTHRDIYKILLLINACSRATAAENKSTNSTNISSLEVP